MTRDGSATARPSPTAAGLRLAGLPRLLGLAARELRLDRGRPQQALDERQVAMLRRLVEERLERVVTGLVEEAATSDDVVDQASARAYLDARLRDLKPFLSAGQLRRIRAAVLARTERW